MAMTSEEIIVEIEKEITTLKSRVKEKDEEFESEKDMFDKGFAAGAGVAYMITWMDLEEIVKKYRGENK